MTESPDKLYFSIREVSADTDVKAHVLRYWETQFSMLRPRKSRAGARMYRAKDVDLVREIKHLLYDRGFTIAGARRHILDRRQGPDEQEAQQQVTVPEIESPTRRGPLLRQIRRELVALQEMLSGPAGTYRPRRSRDD